MPTEPADEPPGPDELLAAFRRTEDIRDTPPNAPAPTPAPGAAAGPVGHAVEPKTRRITFTAEGPALIEGPVEVVAPNGDEILADRFLVALCTCKRSGSYPLCDTSHRRRARGCAKDREGQ
ncbi:CDGSH iron-sulfur domain-containing protein [Nocardia sp. NPDC003963]